jgi:hypothetical protein
MRAPSWGTRKPPKCEVEAANRAPVGVVGSRGIVEVGADPVTGRPEDPLVDDHDARIQKRDEIQDEALRPPQVVLHWLCPRGMRCGQTRGW